jgi:hypothetical protein
MTKSLEVTPEQAKSIESIAQCVKLAKMFFATDAATPEMVFGIYDRVFGFDEYEDDSDDDE